MSTCHVKIQAQADRKSSILSNSKAVMTFSFMSLCPFRFTKTLFSSILSLKRCSPTERSASFPSASVHTRFEQRMRFQSYHKRDSGNFSFSVNSEFLFCICVRNDDNKATIRHGELEHMYANYVKRHLSLIFSFFTSIGVYLWKMRCKDSQRKKTETPQFLPMTHSEL